MRQDPNLQEQNRLFKASGGNLMLKAGQPSVVPSAFFGSNNGRVIDHSVFGIGSGMRSSGPTLPLPGFQDNQLPGQRYDHEVMSDFVLRVLTEAEMTIEEGRSSMPIMDLSLLEPTPIGPNASVTPMLPVMSNTSTRYRTANGVGGSLCWFTSSPCAAMVVHDTCSTAPSELHTSTKRKRETHTEDDEQDELIHLSDSIFESNTASHIVDADDVSGDDASQAKKARFRLYQADQWGERFVDLLQFKKENGHTLVPHCNPANPCLAQWVKRQRYQYKLKRLGRHSTLSDDREQQLDAVGFVWDSHQAAWREKFHDLQKYHSEHGNCRVPPTYEADRALAVWVKCQRRQWKLFHKGEHSTLTNERIQLLDLLDFEWNPRG